MNIVLHFAMRPDNLKNFRTHSVSVTSRYNIVQQGFNSGKIRLNLLSICVDSINIIDK